MSMTSSQKQNETRGCNEFNGREEECKNQEKKGCIYKEGKCVSIY